VCAKVLNVKIDDIGISIFDLSSLRVAIASSWVYLGNVSMYELVLESKTASKIEQIKETTSAIKR
jgi:hypothetical protein